MSGGDARPRLLVIGGCGGLVGRAVLREFSPGWRIRSLHRHADPAEAGAGVEWRPADAAGNVDWRSELADVDTVLNLAWYRWGPERRFRDLSDGLLRAVDAARSSGVRRLVQVSVPPAPGPIESRLPYLAFKRRVDAAVADSGVPYRIVRPTMLYGPGDVLLTVMIRSIDRYRVFPMFGDGRYHVSPVAVADLAHILRREAEGPRSGTVDVGGPERFEYRTLTDEIFRVLGRVPRYLRLRPSNSLRLAAVLEAVGSQLLYRYEVEWLLSDMLGLPAYEGLGRPMARVGPFLAQEAERRRARAPAGA